MPEEKERKLYTIPVAAQRAKVNKRTIRFAIARGEIPAYPLEGTRQKLVYVEDVIAWRDNPAFHQPGRKKQTK